MDELAELDIVEEFNGPQIVFATLDGDRLFGVAADEDESAERWVFAPVSKLEERALRAGIASPREALRKDSALIIDILRGRAGLRVVPVNGEELSDEELPTADARLDPYPSGQTVPVGRLRFVLDRIGGVKDGLPIAAVSDFLRDVQRYSNAVVAFVHSNLSREHGRFSDEIVAEATFSLHTAEAGSLSLDIAATNPQLSLAVIDHLRQATDAGESSQRLASIAVQTGARALRRYEDLLVTLERHELQFLAQSVSGSAFVSWTSASRFSAAMPEAVHRDVEPIVVRGFFRDFGRDRGEFVFIDAETEDVLEGAIGKSVLDENAPITVHETTRYIVMMDRQMVTTRGGKTVRRHVLSRIVEGESPADS